MAAPVRVTCYETGVEYASLSAAARAAGVSCGTLGASLAGGTRSGGFHWFRSSDGPPVGGFRARPGVEVECVETGQTFASISGAARSAGVSPSSLSFAIRTHGRSGGFHWARVSDGAPTDAAR